MRAAALAAWTSALWITWPAAAQLTAADTPPESYAIARGVVVAPASRSIYVLARGEAAGIELLDARSLKPRARSNAASLPLLVDAGRLLVLSAAGAPLRLAWLDARSLRPLETCTPVSLPEWVQPAAADGLGSSFELRAERSGAAIYVRYTASRNYVGGVPPTQEQRAAADRAAEGIVRVERTGGGAPLVETAPAERAPQAFGMEVPYVARPFVRGALEVTVSVDEEVRVTRRRRADKSELAPLRIACETGLAILSLERSALLIADNGPDGSLASARLVDLGYMGPYPPSLPGGYGPSL